MENASKALIIAGAILLSILIIALGMGVYNNATSSTKNANMDAQEVQAHNSQFLSYEGKQNGQNVNALINLLRSNNDKYDDRLVYLNVNWSSTAAVSAPKKVIGTTGAKSSKVTDTKKTVTDNVGKAKSGTTYWVSFDTQENGCISGCEIHIWSSSDTTTQKTMKGY